MGEEQIVQLLLLLLPSRMEIGSLEEKIGSQDRGSTRNNVVDFDFLFEFSPERRTESDLRFEQDQSQQGGSQSQTEGNRSRRSEVRPYPPPGCLLKKNEKHKQAGEISAECSGVPGTQEAQIPVLGRHDPLAGEGERRPERRAHKICRMVSDA